MYMPHKGKVNRYFWQKMEFRFTLIDKEALWKALD